MTLALDSLLYVHGSSVPKHSNYRLIKESEDRKFEEPFLFIMPAGRRMLVFILLFVVLSGSAHSKKRKKPGKDSPETNVFNFLGLFFMRLIYGFASMFGAEEGISDFMGGIFVPPALEDADYRDYLDGDELDY